ncbi:serine hydrolase domain-containing protein [Paenibacillus radicis (ex Gao et al. 2016)]|uniref:Serine hydrolase n=1 Tax=Paenibacillus radicis (ex Gao et al. 2016) TaxID=1737354 RepID=A0A917LVB7_9BACL|nr:serine hydrolase domain-containing protein [Paenibacillus radicis (ex Gao et al. 2016)]GGG59276.1 serine hydrolase [Paenibacillus radicis (ex Gao et al. 2016)]
MTNIIFSEVNLDKFDSFIQDELVAHDKFSGSVLVAKHGKVLYNKAFGMAHKGYGIANRTDTKFNLGSVNKMFTAVSIMKLAEEGLLKIDDRIGKYLPNLPEELANKVSIHQLLTHTAGTGLYWNDKFKAKFTELKSVDDYFPLFINDPLLFEPGTSWAYSNSGYIILGAIIESVSGKDYFTFVRDTIYTPANMLNTDCYDLEYDVPNLAIGYTRLGTEDGGPWRNNTFLHVIKGGPAGGGYSTVNDLLSFDISLRNNKLLSREWTSLATTDKFLSHDNPEMRMQYGYGFMDVRMHGERIIGHNGGFPGVSALLNMYLNSGYTLAVLSNYDIDHGIMGVHLKFDELLFENQSSAGSDLTNEER